MKFTKPAAPAASIAPCQCDWHTMSRRCRMLGTASYNTHAGYLPDGATQRLGPFYCSWHFACLGDPAKAVDRAAFARDYPWPEQMHRAEEFWELTQGWDARPTAMASPAPDGSRWDPRDSRQLRGLLLLGEQSFAWRHAPQAMRDAALAFRTANAPAVAAPLAQTITSLMSMGRADKQIDPALES